MLKLKLHWQIFISLILGVAFGYAGKIGGFTDFITEYVSIAGVLFIRALRMIVVPLIIGAIISGITSISSTESFGRMSAKTFIYYISTTLIAVTTGLFFVNLIKPGVGFQIPVSGELPEDLNTDAGQLVETLIGIIPTNPIEAIAEGNMLPIIFFSLLFGFFILKVEDPYHSTMKDFFNSLFEVMMKMTHFIIKFTPIGVFAFMSKIVAETGFSIFLPIAEYFATVVVSLAFHATITLPALLYILAGVSPIKHFMAMTTPLLTAFSLASSSATLPITMDSLENKAGVSNRTTSFVVPMGSTINMDGTALYELVAAIFIAQAIGFDLTIWEQVIAVLTALLASIGAAGIPMAGLVMITIILSAIGLPMEGLVWIIPVDRILDMMRSSVNTWSDTVGTVIIAKSEGEKDLKVLRES